MNGRHVSIDDRVTECVAYPMVMGMNRQRKDSPATGERKGRNWDTNEG